jgi:hypothetical protein
MILTTGAATIQSANRCNKDGFLPYREPEDDDKEPRH